MSADSNTTSGIEGGPKGSDADVVDELPQDLDISEVVGPITFPNNNRRRIPATLYLLLGAVCIAARIFRPHALAVNSGVLVAGIGLVLFGLYGWFAGRTLRVDESEALAAAGAQVGFTVGHASGQQVWRGWGSRPVWRLLVYSAENPPRRRGIVLVDGVDGRVLEWFAEDNPEDWTALRAR